MGNSNMKKSKDESLPKRDDFASSSKKNPKISVVSVRAGSAVYKKRNSCKVSPLRKDVKSKKKDSKLDPKDFDSENVPITTKRLKEKSGIEIRRSSANHKNTIEEEPNVFSINKNKEYFRPESQAEVIHQK